MSAVGSLIFCNKCGNLLDSVTGESKHIACSQCSTVYDAKSMINSDNTT
jgi:LSD1 subclass zinc finger protein